MNSGCEQATHRLEGIYRHVLAIYPAEFRQEYAAEMVEFFAEDCRRAARRRGWVGLLSQAAKTLWDLASTAPGVHMEIIRQDLRFALRMLSNDKSFALTAILALALGIGSNSAVFSLVHSILLKPLPYPDPDQLVMVWEKSPKGIDRNSVSPPNFMDYRAGASSLAGMAAFDQESANVSGSAVEHFPGMVVTPEFFDVLGVRPIIGTGLSNRAVAADALEVVLSYELWQQHYGQDTAVVGKMLRIDGKNYSVTGVMPESFQFLSRDVALWRSMPASYFRTSRQAHFLNTVARLRRGVPVSRARAELEGLAVSLGQSYPSSNRGWGVTVVALEEQTVGGIRRSLFVLLGAVLFILLIACANVANLLLARSTHRQGEIAIRTALGASVGRICRQMLTESVLLACIGAAAGLVLSWGAVITLKILKPAVVPRLDEVGMDAWVIAFTFGMAVLTGIACGLVPVLRVSRGEVREGLKEGNANRKSFAGHWLRGALIVSEIALSLLLLVGAGLLIRTFVHLQGLDPGFVTAKATSLTIDIPQSRSSNGAMLTALLEDVLARVRSLPGVTSAGMISTLPLTGGDGFNRFGFIRERGEPAGGENHRFYARWISPGYLGSMGIPLLRGRDFTERDRTGSQPAVIIDAVLARRYFPNENPVGQFLRLSYANSTPREIIGVAGEVRLVTLEMEPAPHIYIPVFQEPRVASMSLIVSATGEHTAFAEAARQELHRLDQNLPVYDVRPVAALVSESIAPRRFNMLLMSLLAGAALLLASVGVYGVISYIVGERRQEIGIRIAMGARPAEILMLVLRQGMKYAVAGIAAGLTAALLLTKAMAGLLFGVGPTDAWTFGAVAVLTALVACLACLVPAIRASGMDPVNALRSR